MRNLRDYLVVMILMAAPVATLAARTDTVLLVNGNTITGEVQSYEFGDLEYDTDSMGTVHVDWEDIVAINSNQSLQVEVADGTRFFGSLEAAEERFHVNVVTRGGPIELAMDEIVRITPIETADRFIQRLEGGAGLGLNSQKGSGVTTFNANIDVRYRTRTYLAGVTMTSSITDQPAEETQSNHSIRVNYQRFRPNRWFTDWFGSWERNDQLGITSRYSLGAGLGKYIVQTNRNQFSLMAGAQATHNDPTGQESGTTEGEGRFQVRYLHRNLKPESDISMTVNYFPLLEEFSTYRVDADLVFNREIINDLDFRLDFFYKYQSEPPIEGSRTDHGVITSLVYTW